MSRAKRGLGNTESKEDSEKRTGQPVGKKRVPKTKEQLEERKALLSKAR